MSDPAGGGRSWAKIVLGSLTIVQAILLALIFSGMLVANRRPEPDPVPDWRGSYDMLSAGLDNPDWSAKTISLNPNKATNAECVSTAQKVAEAAGFTVRDHNQDTVMVVKDHGALVAYCFAPKGFVAVVSFGPKGYSEKENFERFYRQFEGALVGPRQ